MKAFMLKISQNDQVLVFRNVKEIFEHFQANNIDSINTIGTVYKYKKKNRLNLAKNNAGDLIFENEVFSITEFSI